jgi:5-carboxymethyl-2-hydroxymuconate isomerase
MFCISQESEPAMPHLAISYTGNLDAETDMTLLCRSLAHALHLARDDAGQPVFQVERIRVLALAAPHYAVADGGVAGQAAATQAARDHAGDYAFVDLNLRMARGRSPATHRRIGDALLLLTKAHFQPLFAQRHIGITLQIDEGDEVFKARHSNLQALFPVQGA